ncbi:hypothetical protein CEY12_02015 [Chryseobacterium sp. T16E-39]|uniref:hypothetical protein n=1 Tax=Chryseobacterium sp. T16E-39 TaxID=2015076 RepID=UPI000B5B3A8B|nr:hypothetical protein [Chryseobacterium sp. T16E-39]ASK28955.1 hypothetical protein CEY12_02015 [Chryseobacterium sp. T16E-39]
MLKETLEINLNSSVVNLFRLAKISCWNKMSQNCLYIVSDCNEFYSLDDKDYETVRRKINNKKNPRNLDSAIYELEKEYDDLYDIVLYVFKAKRNLTVIEIQYYRKSNFDSEYFEVVKNNLPMFHAKISRPIYIGGQDIKFDVNWESQNVRYYFNLWRYRLKQLKK